MPTLGFMHIEQLLRNNKVHNVLYFFRLRLNKSH